MKNQFTPGPWKVEPDNYYNERLVSIIIKENVSSADLYAKDSMPYEEYLANARLIASAPELLEACIHAHDALLSLHVCELDKERCNSLRGELRQAIAKAKAEGK